MTLPIADRLEAAIAALRKLAIVEVHDTAARQVIVVGHRCRVCLDSWNLREREHHVTLCPLEGSQS